MHGCSHLTRLSSQLAQAGFAYTPQEPDDDTASGFYCGVALSGWDIDDSPLYVFIPASITPLYILIHIAKIGRGTF